MSSTAIVFAINSGFLRPLRVLWHTLKTSPRLAALDKIVLTTDPTVASDANVRAAAKMIRLVEPHELEAFSTVKSGMIARLAPKKVHDEIPKYSMLKWFTYDDYGYDRHLFLDADMTNPNNADAILDFDNSFDIRFGPRFEPTIGRDANNDALHERTVGANLLAFCEGRGGWNWRLNSGVLLIGKAMLRPKVRSELIALASIDEFPSDQAVLRAWLRTNPDARSEYFSPFYNFSAGFLSRCDATTRDNLLTRINFLHFIGGKPGERSQRKMKWHDHLWFNVERSAPRHYRCYLSARQQESQPSAN